MHANSDHSSPGVLLAHRINSAYRRYGKRGFQQCAGIHKRMDQHENPNISTAKIDCCEQKTAAACGDNLTNQTHQFYTMKDIVHMDTAKE